MYWKIIPYHNNNADYCIMPADTNEQNNEALKYAQDQLEDQWDTINIGEVKTVTIELYAGDLPKPDYDPNE